MKGSRWGERWTPNDLDSDGERGGKIWADRVQKNLSGDGIKEKPSTMHMNTHAHTCMHTHTHACTHICTCTDAHACMRTHIHTERISSQSFIDQNIPHFGIPVFCLGSQQTNNKVLTPSLSHSEASGRISSSFTHVAERIQLLATIVLESPLPRGLSLGSCSVHVVSYHAWLQC